ncbi:hypothetical protein R5H30_00230 [Sulfitobacter sp. D35]|uniref:hypothetical protein n=1 Tax=Sulfitobacter sp. D35 TaxID=3083252 RepID=UPI00296F273B|nr:hypothetical protein [Sulfitobacter sp. D35]MDW4496391.1 hypothetical protein [Sulfitobacter sp. D35]
MSVRVPFRPILAPIIAAGLTLLLTMAAAAQIEPFVGSYSGSAQVSSADGRKIDRDMSVQIAETRDGFQVNWTSTTYREDGRIKEAKYSINFVPSDRAGVYAAAMKRNVFGHEVQLDPMRGEPYVWARIVDDTLTVYSLYVDADGGYELQQFDRSVAEGGLNLDFQTILDGEIQRTVSTFLERDG